MVVLGLVVLGGLWFWRFWCFGGVKGLGLRDGPAECAERLAIGRKPISANKMKTVP